MTTFGSGNEGATTGPFVMVPVRVELVDEVIAFLAERVATPAAEAARASANPLDAHSTLTGNPGTAWTDEEWLTLYEVGNVTSERIQQILEALASAGAGEANMLSLGELAKRSEMTENQVRHALSRLTLHIVARPDVYGAHSQEEAKWPFAWMIGRNPHNPREFYYGFSVAQHQSWMASQRLLPKA
jgi:hypothetical protein